MGLNKLARARVGGIEKYRAGDSRTPFRVACYRGCALTAISAFNSPMVQYSRVCRYKMGLLPDLSGIRTVVSAIIVDENDSYW